MERVGGTRRGVHGVGVRSDGPRARVRYSRKDVATGCQLFPERRPRPRGCRPRLVETRARGAPRDRRERCRRGCDGKRRRPPRLPRRRRQDRHRRVAPPRSPRRASAVSALLRPMRGRVPRALVDGRARLAPGGVALAGNRRVRRGDAVSGGRRGWLDTGRGRRERGETARDGREARGERARGKGCGKGARAPARPSPRAALHGSSVPGGDATGGGDRTGERPARRGGRRQMPDDGDVRAVPER
mmetsp:Transcript_10783/g.46713  ORF Transcript_10783/g.46713 Transcript_10783/m.46713 type:complete len:244 (-) Transcript_10783:2029-2760(-)